MILFFLSGVRVVQASLLLIVDALFLLVNHCLVLRVLRELLGRESLGLLAQVSPDPLQLLYLLVQLTALRLYRSNSRLGQLFILVRVFAGEELVGLLRGFVAVALRGLGRRGLLDE